MSRILVFAIALWFVPAAAHAQTQSKGVCCGLGALVEVKGTISQVRINPGQGMPSIVVKDGSGESIVLLGSIRYLMARDFNPKVGDEVVAKAYRTANGLLAGSVTLTQQNKTIRLRDDSGRPLWRGPRW